MTGNAERQNKILVNFASILEQSEIKNAVICPGSRSAPFALAIMRNTKIQHFVINDERSAAYVALGLAKNSKQAVVLVCTSGTAALNFAPAIAEAYYQRIPLIVFTADRPSDMINQGENQTIQQFRIFEPNIRASYLMNIVYNDNNAESESYRILTEAIQRSNLPFKGPVHINLPLREPLYSQKIETPNFQFKKQISFCKPESKISKPDINILSEELRNSKRIMFLAGSGSADSHQNSLLKTALIKTGGVLISEITSNIFCNENHVQLFDQIYDNSQQEDREKLKPDLLITFGTSFISKRIREFLKEYKPARHWYIDPEGQIIDTFNSITKLIPVSIIEFLKTLITCEPNEKSYYFQDWQNEELKIKLILENKVLKNKEIEITEQILKSLPSKSVLHLGNSLTVRQANSITIGVNKNAKSIEVFSNRGTSGIDGCTSTALGACLADDKIHTLIIGDQSFLYDINALWNLYVPSRLKIVVLNNKGGGIFRKIEGSSTQAELEEYFVNYVPVDFEKLVKAHGLSYHLTESISDLNKALNKINKKQTKAVVLEIRV